MARRVSSPFLALQWMGSGRTRSRKNPRSEERPYACKNLLRTPRWSAAKSAYRRSHRVRVDRHLHQDQSGLEAIGGLPARFAFNRINERPLIVAAVLLCWSPELLVSVQGIVQLDSAPATLEHLDLTRGGIPAEQQIRLSGKLEGFHHLILLYVPLADNAHLCAGRNV